MSKSFLNSIPFIVFFWGYVFFVHIQCRGTLGIPTESKLPERKELCFRRCDIGLHADDMGILSKEVQSIFLYTCSDVHVEPSQFNNSARLHV